jgi:Ca2+-binding EF-hand superfamily protein
VDISEFSAGLHQLGLGLTDQQVERLVLTLDRDGSGDIDYEEMLAYLHCE